MKVSYIKTQNVDLIGRDETVYAKSESEAAKLIVLYLYHFGELGSVEKRDEAVELLVKSQDFLVDFNWKPTFVNWYVY